MSATAALLAEQRAALETVEKLEARKAELNAEAMAARAEVARLHARSRSGFAEMELAGTALIGQVRASRELDDAARLATLFPKLRELQAAGAVFVPTVEAILAATRRCTAEVQAGVDARVAGSLVGVNVTDVRRLVAHAVLAVEAEIDDQLTRDRLAAAKQDARVWVSPGQDGMTSIGAIIDAVDARRWALDFDQLVRAQKILDARAGVERTLDALRAEVFTHLPTLVLELARAARDGRLADLVELDADGAAELTAELEQLVADTRGLLSDETAADETAADETAADEPPADETPGTVVVGTDTPVAAADAAVDTPADTSADAAVDSATGEIRVETDPFDLDAAAALAAEFRVRFGTDAEHAELLSDVEPPAEGPPPPMPPPWAAAAQDAAFWTTAYSISTSQPPDPLSQVLLLRCLQMPLQKPVMVNLHLPMATALDVTNAPGILDGHGPLDAQRIRELLPDAHLTEIYVDATSGVPLGSGPAERPQPGQATIVALARRLRPVTLTDKAEPQHDPSAALAAFVKLRDQRCPGPGCTLPASRCHLDHEIEHPRGPTAEWNFGDKSARCHGAKHHGWTADRHPDGTTVWTSPTGRTYTSSSVWPRPPRITKPTCQIHLVEPTLHIEIEMESHA
jgi:hypothetical protein